MDGQLFATLTKLTTLHLHGNVCINQSISRPNRITSLVEKVNEKCRFDRPEVIEASMKELKADNARFKAEVQTLQSELKELKTQLTINESQWNATCIAQVIKLLNNLQFNQQTSGNHRQELINSKTQKL